MAKEFSFDCVSQVDMQEADNAFGQAKKELAQRYDLKDSGATIDLDKGEGKVTIVAPSDFVLGQVKDIFTGKLVKRNIDLQACTFSAATPSSGGNVTSVGTFVNGIEKEKVSAINKDIKAQKFKAKTQIEGDKLRVSSASKDTLQEVITFLKGQDYGIPLQFINYR